MRWIALCVKVKITAATAPDINLLMQSSNTSQISSPFLGTIVEVCIVTPSAKHTMDGLLKLGIGPFQVFSFNSDTVPTQQYRGGLGCFELKVCFAKQGALTFEIMQPISGPSLMAEYLEKSGGNEGIQHVAFDLGNVPMAERQARMKAHGFDVAMEGRWKGRKGECHFCFFDTEGSTGTVFESIEFSEDWEDPECLWYPAPPGQDAGVEHGLKK